jgi:hypothetical protein
MDKCKDPVILSVIIYCQNPLEYTDQHCLYLPIEFVIQLELKSESSAPPSWSEMNASRTRPLFLQPGPWWGFTTDWSPLRKSIILAVLKFHKNNASEHLPFREKFLSQNNIILNPNFCNFLLLSCRKRIECPTTNPNKDEICVYTGSPC